MSGLFDGVENVADFNQRIEGETFLEFTGVDFRDHKADPDKRMIIFNYSYTGPKEFFKNETVSEFYTLFKDMSPENLAKYTEREVSNATRAFQNMCKRLMSLGFSKAEVDNKTADPKIAVGRVIKTNVYYNNAGYLQFGNAVLVPEKASQKPSKKGNLDNLLND